jgi:YidC/Oxa1 family membrane protein insertase
MDTRRLILYAALAFVGMSLWSAWQVDYPAKQAVVAQNTPSVLSTSSNNNSLPIVMPSTAKEPELVLNKESNDASSHLIHVTTDVLNISISLKQGDIVHAALLDYPISTEEKDKPFILLQDNPNDQYVANSNLFTANNQKIQTLDLAFESPQTDYKLAPDSNQMTVTLTGKTKDGLVVTKNFMVQKGSYLIDVTYNIHNAGSTDWKGYFNTQLLRTSPKEDKSSIFHVGSYTGGSYSNPGKQKFQKVSFVSMAKANLDTDVTGGWIAMQQHYFLTAWIPNTTDKNKFYTRAVQGDYTIGSVSQPIIIQPDAQTTVGSKLYVGPENTSVLKSIAPSLDLTVDYGILWFVSSLLFSLMKAINSFVGNWGWSIVLVTILIKLAFYRLSATSYKSMAGMRKLQPKLQALRERYGDDKAKISQATMELYKQEKVNPLGGCLPILIQIPVFIALYWVLLESVELRQAPFILWITDLASADPYHVLPLIMGGTMLIQQKLNPAPPDPVQAKVMMFLPLLFTGLFWNFPAGLVLYWIVNNTLSILQQWYITQKYSEDKPVKKIRAKTVK